MVAFYGLPQAEFISYELTIIAENAATTGWNFTLSKVESIEEKNDNDITSNGICCLWCYKAAGVNGDVISKWRVMIRL